MNEGPDRRRRPRWRRLAGAFGVMGVVAIAALFPRWKAATDRGGQQPAEPFRIAGTLHYVGANDVAAFLVTGPEGHVLIDGGYPGTAALITRSVETLGFDLRDVKVLLNSEPHFDHGGGLAALQQASGAELWASAASARVLEARGVDPDVPFWARAVQWVIRYPAPRVHRVVRDGDTVRVGPLALVAHVTGGHTRGCTSWSFTVREGARDLRVVSACSLVMLGVGRYDGQEADFARTVQRLRALDPDIWVTSHARRFGRYAKFAARDTAADPVAPFIDRAGFRAYVDSGEARIRRGQVQ